MVFGEAIYHADCPFEQWYDLLTKDPGNPEAWMRGWGLDRALSGDMITEQDIHALDVMNWIMQEPPLYAIGSGGLTARPKIGTCWDHFAVYYQYPNKVVFQFSGRQFNGYGTPEGIRNRMFGSKGVLETEYGGNVLIRGENFFRGGKTTEIYEEGTVNNIAAFAIGDLNNLPFKSDLRAEQWLEQSIDICRAMDVKVVLVPFFGKGDLRNDPKGMAAVIERLKRIAPKAEKAGVILALESWLSADDHLKIIKAVGSPAVQVYYDVGNSQEAGYDIFKEIRLLGNRICQFHAKDTKTLYGQGSMDFKAVRKAMEDIGYRGWFVLEGTELPLGIEKSVRYDLDYLRTIFPARQK